MKERTIKIIAAIAIIVTIATLTWAVIAQCRVEYWKNRYAEQLFVNIHLTAQLASR